MYSLNLPSHVLIGPDSRNEIINIIVRNQYHNVLLLTDKGIMGTGRIQEMLSLLEGINVTLIQDVPTEPERDQVRGIYKKAAESAVEMIIAVGGGSVMDTAKLVSGMLTNPEFSVEVIEPSKLVNDPIPTAMIPTTAGTGSEATQNAIVLVAEMNLKVGVVSGKFIPAYVILDPVLTLSVPAKITASTGIDALCHAVETMISKKTNPICQTFSLRAIKLIFENLETCYLRPDDLKARENMLLAAFFGGICINTSSTVAVHALSYPLGGSYHIAHGVSNAMLAAEVLKYNTDVCIDDYNLIADILGIDSSLSKVLRAEKSVEAISNLIKSVGIPTDLTEFNVPREDIDFLTDSAFEVKRLLDQNPKAMTKADIHKIYETLFPA